MQRSLHLKMLIRRVIAAVTRAIRVPDLLEHFRGPSWRIITYHRIINPEQSPYPLQPGMYVRPETFDMQMKFLLKNSDVLPLDELLENIIDGKALPRRSVAITFDDGWVDNYTNAFPVLLARKLPVTIFLPTAFVGTGECFWTDRVARAIYGLRREKKYIQSACARLEEDVELSSEVADELISLLSLSDVENLQDAFDACIEHLKPLPFQERNNAVVHLERLAKEFCALDGGRSFCTWAEIQEMAHHGVTFGSHSHHHYNLTHLTEAQLRDEVDNSYHILRSHGLPISKVFCYPGGHFDDMTQKVLADRSVLYALSNEYGTDFEELPLLFGRIGIHEDISCTPSLFAFRLWVQHV